MPCGTSGSGTWTSRSHRRRCGRRCATTESPISRLDFYAKARELQQRGEPFVTAVVVRVEPPTSAKPGDRALVTRDGELFGWIGGSCARPVVVEESRQAIREGRGRLVRLSSDPAVDGGRLAGLTDREMTCYSGGTMEIFLQPDLPRPRLLLVGDQPVAHALARLAAGMGYEVVEVVPGGGEPVLDGVTGTLSGIESIAGATHPLSFVVVATHGVSDELAVEKALAGPAPYVGLVASRRRAGAIRAYLRGCGISAERLDDLRSPAGLDIAAREPEEIALSILAEIVSVWRAAPEAGWSEQGAEASEISGEPVASPAEPASTAVDPICGMQVATDGNSHTAEHEGETFYFCCGGCLTRFVDDPTAALARDSRG